jgi:uncharacterized protein
MAESTLIPMFPLALLPLPGELVPLHIFEPRYRQLLQDAETNDIVFGIYFSHEMNLQKVGSLMKLESIIKRYPNGESDIIVKCNDIFTMDKLYRIYKNKDYPGGDITPWLVDVSLVPGPTLFDLFVEYMALRNITRHVTGFDLYQIAIELGLDFADRYKFLNSSEDRKENFLLTRLKFQYHVLKQEEKSKDVFHLN